MSTDPAVKVFCPRCKPPRLLCHVIATPKGLAYKLTIGARGGWASGPSGVFCARHGWPDLAAPVLAAKLARSAERGQAVTHLADMMPQAPTPQ